MINAFLDGIAMHVCDFRPMTKEYLEAGAAIQGCLTSVLWRAQQVSEYDLDPDYGDLELQLNGTPGWYFQRREAPAFRKKRVVPNAHNISATRPGGYGADLSMISRL